MKLLEMSKHLPAVILHAWIASHLEGSKCERIKDILCCLDVVHRVVQAYQKLIDLSDGSNRIQSIHLTPAFRSKLLSG